MLILPVYVVWPGNVGQRSHPRKSSNESGRLTDSATRWGCRQRPARQTGGTTPAFSVHKTKPSPATGKQKRRAICSLQIIYRTKLSPCHQLKKREVTNDGFSGTNNETDRPAPVSQRKGPVKATTQQSPNEREEKQSGKLSAKINRPSFFRWYKRLGE